MSVRSGMLPHLPRLQPDNSVQLNQLFLINRHGFYWETVNHPCGSQKPAVHCLAIEKALYQLFRKRRPGLHTAIAKESLCEQADLGCMSP